MIKEFALCWEKRKDELKKYFRTHEQGEYDSYEELVRLLFDLVINPEIGANGCLTDYYYKFNTATDQIVVLDNGCYQGTQLFILYRNTYPPDPGDYVCTWVYYGSCSGCDTLQGIHNYYYGIPSEEQLNGYMTLCLHLLQHCRFMADDGEEEMEEAV